jgi:hypothetical protein
MYPFTGTLSCQSTIIDAVPVDAVAAVPADAGLGRWCSSPTTVAAGGQDLVTLLLPGFASKAHESGMGGRHFGPESGGSERMADDGYRLWMTVERALMAKANFQILIL